MSSSSVVVVEYIIVYALPCFTSTYESNHYESSSQNNAVQGDAVDISGAFPLTENEEELLFIIFQYVIKMFSLAVLGQVIPGRSESPFRAAGLRRCRA